MVMTTLMKTKSLQITAKLIEDFASLTDDHNPIHFDEDFAKNTIFKKPIAHGMISANLIASCLATNFPGAIYIKQKLKFLKPVFIGDKITAKLEILSQGKTKIQLKTICQNQKEEVVIEGEAWIKRV